MVQICIWVLWICIWMHRILFKWFKFAFEFPFECFKSAIELFAFEWFEFAFKFANEWFEFPFEWFQFAFEGFTFCLNGSSLHSKWFESRNGLNLHSRASNSIWMVQICIRMLQICNGMVGIPPQGSQLGMSWVMSSADTLCLILFWSKSDRLQCHSPVSRSVHRYADRSPGHHDEVGVGLVTHTHKHTFYA